MPVESKGLTRLNFAFNYREVTGSVDINIQDDIVAVSGSGPTTTTLPPVQQTSGKQYVVKNLSANTVTVEGSGSDQIDQAANVSLSVQDASVTVASTGTKWIII